MAELTAARPARRSGRGALLLSLFFGVLAAILAFRYLSNQEPQRVEVVVTPPTAPVVVAARDLPERTVLTADMLTVKQVPQDALHPQHVADPATVIGRVTRYPLLAGEPLLQPRLVSAEAGLGLTGVIPKGARAVSIGVTEVIGAAGLINPGDHVDVLASFEREEAGKDAAVIVLQNILVLAVAQDVTPLDDNGSSAAQTGDGPVSSADAFGQATTALRTVTLAVTPEQAERLFLSETKGSLRLALRPLGETEETEVPAIELPEIVGP